MRADNVTNFLVFSLLFIWYSQGGVEDRWIIELEDRYLCKNRIGFLLVGAA